MSQDICLVGGQSIVGGRSNSLNDDFTRFSSLVSFLVKKEDELSRTIKVPTIAVAMNFNA